MIYVFDFDGTLVDTNNLKLNCIIKTLRSHTGCKLSYKFINEFANKFIQMSGITREKKFMDLLSHKLDQNSIQELIKKYSELVIKEINNEYIDSSVITIINRLQEKNSVFICSGARLREIEMVLRNSDPITLDGIYCSRLGKTTFLKFLNQQDEVVFFGDSEDDYSSAKIAKVAFVRVTQFSSLEIDNFTGKSIKSIKDYFN
tara:strand:- start:12415 stop:13020 length:606 start_codon:yes stop_codon:yes gene_type:complete